MSGHAVIRENDDGRWEILYVAAVARSAEEALAVIPRGWRIEMLTEAQPGPAAGPPFVSDRTTGGTGLRLAPKVHKPSRGTTEYRDSGLA